MLFGLTDDVETTRSVRVHRDDCGSYQRAMEHRRSGPYPGIEEARAAGREHPREPCVMMCRECHT